MCRDPALLTPLLPGCGLTVACVGREPGKVRFPAAHTGGRPAQGLGGACLSAPALRSQRGRCSARGAAGLSPGPPRSGPAQASQREQRFPRPAPSNPREKQGHRGRRASSQRPARTQPFSYFSRNRCVCRSLLLITSWIRPNQNTLTASGNRIKFPTESAFLGQRWLTCLLRSVFDTTPRPLPPSF